MLIFWSYTPIITTQATATAGYYLPVCVLSASVGYLAGDKFHTSADTIQSQTTWYGRPTLASTGRTTPIRCPWDKAYFSTFSAFTFCGGGYVQGVPETATAQSIVFKSQFQLNYIISKAGKGEGKRIMSTQRRNLRRPMTQGFLSSLPSDGDSEHASQSTNCGR
jgi:hypothetical protein